MLQTYINLVEFAIYAEGQRSPSLQKKVRICMCILQMYY